MPDLPKLYEAIVHGDHKAASALTLDAINANIDAMEILSGHMTPAMDEVGRRFECEEYFVPELLLSARAMKSALEHIRPLLASQGAAPAGRIVIGTVKGDQHDIGKNIVAAMLEGGGFEVIDLGADVAPQRFIQAVHERKPHVLCMSALLTVTLPSMKSTIEAITAAGLRDQVRILVGGAPVSPEFARQIGADGYGANAAVAVTLARQMVRAA